MPLFAARARLILRRAISVLAAYALALQAFLAAFSLIPVAAEFAPDGGVHFVLCLHDGAPGDAGGQTDPTKRCDFCIVHTQGLLMPASPSLAPIAAMAYQPAWIARTADLPNSRTVYDNPARGPPLAA